MKKILVSACLLGDPVRYDARSKPANHARLDELTAQQRVVSFCPEVAGGLPVPRQAAEISGGDGAAVIAGVASVITQGGSEVTRAFLSGAEQALELCRKNGIEVAVLTESSPSCGSGRIYDGSFTRNAVPGSGVTAALLRRHGIKIFNQHRLDRAFRYLESCSDKE